MHNELVSVIITTFNGEKFIRESVDSIVRQTYKNLEIIVIDDGSNDNTADIIKSISDNRIKYFRTENNGHVSALNYGLSLSNGDYVSILDHDDIAMPQKIEKQMNCILSNPELGVISHFFLVMDERGKIIYEIHLPKEDEEIKKELCLQNIISHSGVLYKKKIVLEAGGYREKYGKIADYDLWLRLRLNTKFINLDEMLLKYRKHNNGQSFSLKSIKEANISILKVLEENISIIEPNYKNLKIFWQIRYGEKRISILKLCKTIKSRKYHIKKTLKFFILNLTSRDLKDYFYFYNPLLRFRYFITSSKINREIWKN
ncbi:MAG: glycosyltransferase [Ignavibacteria bacterium]|nr:glycosyltransferase [Ignavibacteria bacterium]